MHEMALVHQVVEIVLDYAERINACEVTDVRLTVGAGRDVIEDYMEGLFSFVARNTVAEHAKLVIKRTPYAVRCNQCGEVFPLDVGDRSTWTCPRCRAEKDYKLFSGMEFTVDQIGVIRDSGQSRAV